MDAQLNYCVVFRVVTGESTCRQEERVQASCRASVVAIVELARQAAAAKGWQISEVLSVTHVP